MLLHMSILLSTAMACCFKLFTCQKFVFIYVVFVYLSISCISILCILFSIRKFSLSIRSSTRTRSVIIFIILWSIFKKQFQTDPSLISLHQTSLFASIMVLTANSHTMKHGILRINSESTDDKMHLRIAEPFLQNGLYALIAPNKYECWPPTRSQRITSYAY